MVHQAEVVRALVGQLSEETGGAPVLLIGHSMGAVLALHVAASAGDEIAAVDISGLPFVFDTSLVDMEQLRSVDYLPDNPVEFKRQLFYGPEGSFEAEVLEADVEVSRPIPAAEIIDAVECPLTTPLLASELVVPVQITRAEYDNSSGGGREGLDRCGALFTRSPRVVLQWQIGSGHNISLHRVARAYHLRAVAFFDEALRLDPAIVP